MELHVQLVKKKIIKKRGWNFTYLSAKKATLSAHEENAVSLKAGKTRTKTDSSNDVYHIMNELLEARVFHSEAGRTYVSFDNFRGVYERINLPKLHS